MTPECAQEFPQVLKAELGEELPDVLLAYQQRLLAATAIHQVTVVEKSRRIGVTWAIAADAVLTSAVARSAGGMDTFYIGYNYDMAREFIDTCAMWATAFNYAATDVAEEIFEEKSRKGEDITAFKITFASGFEIKALSSQPRSFRGKQGYAIIDEAAFHDDLPGLLKAALAFLMWGGKVLVISTHNGDIHPFNGLVNDVRSGRKPFALLRITFDDAIADGLYERVALMMAARGREIAPKEEWIADIRAFYGEDGDEELDVIPSEGSGTWLPGALIEARMDAAVPVLRLQRPDSFVHQPVHIREADIDDWLEDEVKPLLAALDPTLKSYFGHDFGRVSDLSVLWPLQVQQNLVRRPPFIIELRNIPFAQQRQVLFYVVKRLPRFMAGAMDAGGNGAQLAEEAADAFGHMRIEQVKFSVEWYRENMPAFGRAFEDNGIVLPKDADVLADHRLMRKIDGVARVPPIRTKDAEGKNRHGDSAIANALAFFATLMDPREYGYTAAPPPRGAFDTASDYGDDEDDGRVGSGLHGMKGAWRW